MTSSSQTTVFVTRTTKPGLLRAIGGWSFRHRRIVLGLWAAALIVLIGLSHTIGTAYNDSFSLPNTDSYDAQQLLQKAAPKAAGDVDQIVVATSRGKITDPQVRIRLQRMFDQVAALPHVGHLASPFARGDGVQISKSGTIAYATITFDETANQLPLPAVKRVIHVAQAAAGDGLQVQLGGQAIEAANPTALNGTALGLLAAAVVLFLVFGSLLGMLLPLITAVFALGVGISVMGLLSNTISMVQFSSTLAVLIGLGVGVDYALFIVTRFRQALMRGIAPADAAVEAIDTSGRAVLLAGTTVCIALLGMFALGVTFLYGIAIAASVVVACTVLAALTLLPALLGFFGPRVLRRKIRRTLTDRGSLTINDESAVWARWAARMQRRPAFFAVAATVLILVIAIPFLSIRLGSADQGSDPANTTTRQAYDLLAEGFGPGFNGPLQLVAAIPTTASKTGFERVLTLVAHDPDVAAVTPAQVIPGRGTMPAVATANVIPKGSPQAASTTALINRLRDDTIPTVVADGGPRMLIGGQTAIFEDFSRVISNKLPLFIFIVVALSWLLLMVVFRSLLIPTMASIMNLFSAAAALGVVTAIFQWGWGASLIGVDRTGPIEAFLPVIVFAILFGLSMDYEVFLISRIHEQWHARPDNSEAVTHGLAATGRTINAAAAIMVLVFAAFILGGAHVIKLFGVGLASAVLFDALIVRSVLVPSLMLLAGNANWWLPRPLQRLLPRLNVESGTTPTAIHAET